MMIRALSLPSCTPHPGLQCSGAIMAKTRDEALNDSNMAKLAALRRAVASLPLGRS